MKQKWNGRLQARVQLLLCEKVGPSAMERANQLSHRVEAGVERTGTLMRSTLRRKEQGKEAKGNADGAAADGAGATAGATAIETQVATEEKPAPAPAPAPEPARQKTQKTRWRYEKTVLTLLLSQLQIQFEFHKFRPDFFPLQDVHRVIKGWQSSSFMERKETLESQGFKPSQCFSVEMKVSHSQNTRISRQVYDVIAPTSDIANELIDCLHRMHLKSRKPLYERIDDWLAEAYRQADTTGDGMLSFEEILSLLVKLNCGVTRDAARKLFQEVDIESQDGSVRASGQLKNPGDQKLNMREFATFYNRLINLQEIEDFFMRFAEDDFMDLDEWVKMWTRTGAYKSDPESVDKCRHAFHTCLQRYEHTSSKESDLLSLQSFKSMFLVGDEFSIEEPVVSKAIYQDMRQPLNHYWINSSHNTYLLGNQLTGEASVEGYQNALRLGARCVELDVWDGDDEKGPVVTHGHTFCGKISLADVLRAINEVAFLHSQFPLILSIENHCSKEQQRMMASMIRGVFGYRLLTAAQVAAEPTLPSPFNMRFKVLVKSSAGEEIVQEEKDETEGHEVELETVEEKPDEEKAAEKPEETAAEENPEETATEEKPEETAEEKPEEPAAEEKPEEPAAEEKPEEKQPEPEEKPEKPEEKDSSSSESSSSSDEEDEPEKPKPAGEEKPEEAKDEADIKLKPRKKSKRRRIKFAPEMTEIIGLPGRPFRGLAHAQTRKYHSTSSFSEARLNKLGRDSADGGAAFIKFTHKNLARTYPSGTRVDSSNYCPFEPMLLGAQMVALNFQIRDQWLDSYLHMFRDNGSSGFLLKPFCLMNPISDFSPFGGNFPEEWRRVLHLTVLSAYQLPRVVGKEAAKAVIDPYVTVQLFGVPEDLYTVRTPYRKDQGLHPVWNHKASFDLRVPSLAMIRFEVHDHQANVLVCSYTMRCEAMRLGLRTVPLYKPDGMKDTFARLFVIAELEDGAGRRAHWDQHYPDLEDIQKT